MYKSVINHTFDTSYVINDVIDENGVDIKNFEKLYDFIEKITTELFENLFRIALKNMSAYKYAVLGGKAINNIINLKYLKKSFDYDIHMFDSTKNELDLFGNKLAIELNEVIKKFNLYRFYIINILKRYKLITNKEVDHYKNNTLFYYGERKKPSFSIKGIFIHFVFKSNLIAGGKIYSNNTPPSLIQNELYYPLSDIDLDDTLNFGLVIKDQRYTTQNYDNVNYANYSVVLHNLIKYTERPGIKQNANFNKLKNFVEIDKYSCFLLTDNEKIEKQLTNMLITTKINNKLPQQLYINANPIINVGDNVVDIISEIINKYNTDKIQYSNVCINNAILDNTAVTKNSVFKSLTKSNENILLNLFEKEASVQDVDGFILYYSGNGFTPINTYLDNDTFGIDNTKSAYSDLHIMDVIVFSDKSKLTINKIINVKKSTDMEHIVTNISTIIQDIKKSPTYINNLGDLNDEFYVYRLQNFMCINSPNGDQFNPSILKPRTIIHMSRFLSTSFVTNFDYVPFLLSNSLLFKIKINKESPNWIFLNKYSLHPTEKEILINKNVYFLITNVDSLPIRVNSKMRDIIVIEMVLCDNMGTLLTGTNKDLIQLNNATSKVQYITNQNQSQSLTNSNQGRSRPIDPTMRSIEMIPTIPIISTILNIVNIRDDVLNKEINRVHRIQTLDKSRENDIAKNTVIRNLNTLLYDPAVIENNYISNPCNELLIQNMEMYDNLHKAIINSGKDNILEKNYTTQIMYNTNELYNSIKPKIIIRPNNQNASAPVAGGNYNYKYNKYKQKYLELK